MKFQKSSTTYIKMVGEQRQRLLRQLLDNVHLFERHLWESLQRKLVSHHLQGLLNLILCALDGAQFDLPVGRMVAGDDVSLGLFTDLSDEKAIAADQLADQRLRNKEFVDCPLRGGHDGGRAPVGDC